MRDRKGGRRKGDSGHRNDGLLKRCGCSRKRWSDCLHPWWFNLCVDKTSFRFNMTKRAGLPPKKPLSRSEAERWRDHFRTLARNGEITRRGRPTHVAGSKPGDGQTLRQVSDAFIEHWKDDPNRRAHRLPPLEKHLASICRTVIAGEPFGDRAFESIQTSDIESFRDARRRILKARDAERAERAPADSGGSEGCVEAPTESRAAARTARRGRYQPNARTAARSVQLGHQARALPCRESVLETWPAGDSHGEGSAAHATTQRRRGKPSDASRFGLPQRPDHRCARHWHASAGAAVTPLVKRHVRCQGSAEGGDGHGGVGERLDGRALCQ